MDDLRLSAQYSTYSDLQTAVEKYCDTRNVQLVKANSRSVTVANKSVQPGKKLYPDKFKYSSVTYTCKHSGNIRATGCGIRAKQRSYKLKCPFKMVVIGNRDLDVLVVKSFSEGHNHEISTAIYKSYPEQRRLNTEETNVAHKMLEHSIPAGHVSRYLSSMSGKNVTAKDIQNLKNTGEPEQVRLANVPNQILETDEGTVITMTLDKDDTINFIYIQSSAMKSNFARFPEVLVMDTTYKVNNKNMHLATLMSIDGNGNGVIAAHALVSSESKELMVKFLTTFVQYNSVASTKTEVVLVDKDFSEIGAIAETMPSVSIHLCMWHVLCAMRRRLCQEKLEDEHQNNVRKILQELAYAHSQKCYDEAKKMLEIQTTGIPKFYKYFLDNWDDCKEKWAYFMRQDVTTFGNRTTNYIESFHQKIKRRLTKTTCLDGCIKVLFDHSQSKFEEIARSESLNRNVIRYNLKEESPIAQQLYSLSTEYAANTMIRQMQAAKKSSFLDIHSTDNNHYNVKDNKQEFRVTLSKDVYKCSCHFFQTMRMLCKHAFMCILKHNLAINGQWISHRWQLHGETGENLSASSSRKIKRTVPFKANKKFQVAMGVLKEIAGACSCSSSEDFQHKLTQLEQLKDAWNRGSNVTITILPTTSNSGNNEEVTVDVQELETEHTDISATANFTATKDKSPPFNVFNTDIKYLACPTDSDDTKDVTCEISETAISTADVISGPTPNKNPKAESEPHHRPLSSKVIIRDHSGVEKKGIDLKLKVKATLNKQPPERRNAVGLKRKVESVSQKKAKKSKSDTKDHVFAASPLSAYVQRANEGQLLHLLQTADAVEYITSTEILTDPGVIATDPVRSLERELEVAGYSGHIEDAVVDITSRLKTPLARFGDLSKRTDLVHVMAILITFAYSTGLSIKDAVPTILPLPIDETPKNFEMTWPRLNRGIKHADRKYRLGNNTVTLDDLQILPNGAWLNDRIIHAFLGFMAQKVNDDRPLTVFVLPSFLAVKWEKNDYTWMFEKVPLVQYDWVLLPICTRDHWILLAANMKKGEVNVYDSLHNTVRKQRYIRCWRTFMEKKYQGQQLINWTVSGSQSNQQKDGSSCGVFLLMNAAAIMKGLDVKIIRHVHCNAGRRYVARTIFDNMKDNKDAVCDLPFCLLPSIGKRRRTQWILCDECDRWCHYACVNIHLKPKGRFLCTLCAMK